MNIPLHLIAGPLGVGKTTAIRNYVAASPEFTAVLVNDFGQTGYDAAFIAEAGTAGGIAVENIPGGCLCCTTAAQLLPALKTLCARPDVRRILVEPSGVALLDPLIRLLLGAQAELGFEFRPVIALFDPERTPVATLRQIPYFRSFADHAGIAVLNRCDLSAPGKVQALFQCLENWTPAKLRVIRTAHGELPPELFELRHPVVAAGGHHHHEDIPAAGTFRSLAVFNAGALAALLAGQTERLARFKGIFHTDDGWQRLEIAGGRLTAETAYPAEQSRAEWVGCGSELAGELESLADVPAQQQHSF